MSPRRPVRRRAAAAIAGLACLLVTACGSEDRQVDFTGTEVDPPFEVSDTQLEGAGGPVSLRADLDHRLTLVFFGYSNCPDICSAVLLSVASGLQRLPDAERQQVDLKFVTSDPERDTAGRMKAYLARFDPTFDGLTGSIDDIAEVAYSIGVFVDTGAADVDGRLDPNSHGTYVIGLEANGDAPVIWDQETAPSEFATDFSALLAG